MPQFPDPTFAWDQYWRDGRLASCSGEGGINYHDAIAEGWRRFFSTLSDGARILDICTGNGAIARLASEAARARSLKVSIDAVDAAMINPPGSAPGADVIRFSPRTPAEDLPFPDASFDVIVGQYAIEYTDVERSLAELNRVSRQAVSIRFVTHAAGSIVVQEAKRQLDDAERLLATGIFEAAEAFVRLRESHMDAIRTHDARGSFQNAVRALQSAATGSADMQMYRNVGNVVVHAVQQQPHAGAGPVLDKIAETASAVRAHQARLSAMRRAALDASGAQSLLARAERLWPKEFELNVLARSDGAVLGWVLESDPGQAILSN